LSRFNIGIACGLVALVALGAQRVVVHATARPTPGPCATADHPGATCRFVYRGRQIGALEFERRAAHGRGGAAVTPQGVYLFDTVAELDRFQAGRRVEVAP